MSSPARTADGQHRIDPALFAAQGVAMKGELWAMMLDAKRTFDEIVTRLAPEERAREEILANPHLPRAVLGGGRLAGAERDRQAV